MVISISEFPAIVRSHGSREAGNEGATAIVAGAKLRICVGRLSPQRQYVDDPSSVFYRRTRRRILARTNPEWVVR